jgi:hypothetical protein
MFDAYGVGVRAGAITPQSEDEAFFRREIGLPNAAEAVNEVWSDEPTRRPITLTQPGGDSPLSPPQSSIIDQGD